MRIVVEKLGNIIGLVMIITALTPEIEPMSVLDISYSIVWFIAGIAFFLPWIVTKKYLGKNIELALYLFLTCLAITLHLFVLYQNMGAYDDRVIFFIVGYIVLVLNVYHRYKLTKL